MNLASLAPLACLLSVAVQAQDLIVPQQETRTARCRVGSETASESGIPGTRFRSFVALSGPIGAAEAVQDSTIHGASMNILLEQSSSGSSSVWADAVFDVTFALTAKSQYRFAGSYSGYDNGFAQAFFYGPGSQVLVAEHGTFTGAYDIDYAGVLNPGVYRVRAVTTGGDGASSATYDLDVEFTALSGAFCTGSPNSVGAGAELGFSGSQDLHENDFVLEGTAAPASSFSLFVYGDTQSSIPLGNGTLCVGQPFFRLSPPIHTDSSGSIALPLDFTAGPLSSGPGAVSPGSTWNFQWIYRDPVGAGFNLSNGLWVTFCP